MIRKDLDFTLLSKDNITATSNDYLQVFNQYGLAASITDLGVITGGGKSYNKAEKNDYLYGRATWYATKSGEYYECEYCVVGIDDEGGRWHADHFFRDCAIRPVIDSPSLFDELFEHKKRISNDIYVVEYGEYPQYASFDQDELDRVFKYGEMKFTGKTYSFDSTNIDEYYAPFRQVDYKEYVYNNRKYVHIKANIIDKEWGYPFFCKNPAESSRALTNDTKCVNGKYIWVEVKPIEWILDIKSKKLISKRCLTSGIRFCSYEDGLYNFDEVYDDDFEGTEMYYYLNNILKYDALFDNDIPKLLSRYGIESYIHDSKDTLYRMFFMCYIKNYYPNKIKDLNKIRNYVNELIIKDLVPEDILKYITTLDGWHLRFTNAAYKKIIRYKTSNILNYNTSIIESIEQGQRSKQINLYPYFYNIVYDKNTIVMYLDLCYLDLENKVEFGEYPTKKVSKREAVLLDTICNERYFGIPEDSGIDYSQFIYNKVKHDVYIIHNRKFININNEWMEIEPLKWIYNKDGDYLVLDSEIPNINKLEKKSKLKVFFEEAIMNYVINNRDNFIKCEEKTNECRKEEVNNKLKEVNKLVEEEQRKQNEIKIRKEKMINLLREAKEIEDELYLLNSPTHVTRFSYSKELLLNKVDDHLEFNPDFIPYLRFIDLSLISSKNLKVSGIDFSDTNIYLEPQKVWRKDLSGSIFDDHTFVFKDFRGCDLRGTDLSNETDCYGFEDAIIDENTKLPKEKTKKL